MSTAGGSTPVWSRNGRELFYYIDAANVVKAVPVQTSGSTSTLGNAVSLFKAPMAPRISSDDVAPDGRFLMIKEHAAEGQGAATPRMVVVLNFFQELKRLVPTK